MDAKYIRRIIPLLPAAEQTKAEARLAVYLRSAAADKLMASLTADEKADWGLAFQRAQLLRRQGKPAEAAKILLASPTDPNPLSVPTTGGTNGAQTFMTHSTRATPSSPMSSPRMPGR